MNVTDQLKQIGIFFTQKGPISVLEQVSVPLVSPVKGDGISGHSQRMTVGMGLRPVLSRRWTRLLIEAQAKQTVDDSFRIFRMPQRKSSYVLLTPECGLALNPACGNSSGVFWLSVRSAATMKNTSSLKSHPIAIKSDNYRWVHYNICSKGYLFKHT